MMISKMSGQQSEGFTELEITYIQLETKLKTYGNGTNAQAWHGLAQNCIAAWGP